MLNTLETSRTTSGDGTLHGQANRRTIVVVEPDRSTQKRLCKDLESVGFDVEAGSDSGRAIEAVALRPRLDALLVDTSLGGMAPLQLISLARQRHPKSRIVVLTAHGSMAGAFKAIKAGADCYLEKPCDTDRLLAALGGADEEAPPAPRMRLPFGRVAWEHVHRIYELSGRSRSEAARRLGMHRRSLQRMMAKRAPR